MIQSVPNRIVVVALAFLVGLPGAAPLTGVGVATIADPAQIGRLWLVNPAMPADALKKRMSDRQTVGLIVELSEQHELKDYEAVAVAAKAAGVPLYGWIEIARQPELAKKHPEWLAGLGHHADWRKRFPDFPKTEADEVVKAFPWVTIWYQEAFDAHVARARKLLAQAPRDLAGVYLNDIQGAPASCGCGNDQCRWAQDYHVRSTATKLDEPATPARFVAEIRKMAAGKPVIPVWCIECEEIDQDYSRPGTGFCGSVGCYKGLCWKEYFRQLGPVVKQMERPLAVASFSGEFCRRGQRYETGTGWIAESLKTFSELAPRHQQEGLAPPSLQPVLQGWDDDPPALERELRQAAAAGCKSVVVALTRIDQSWRPLVHVLTDK
jgi:hypothetical protein